MPSEKDKTEKIMYMSAGEMMSTMSEYVAEENQISQAAISGMFRKLAEEFYVAGMDADIAKEKSRSTLMNIALALDNCSDPKNPETYNAALEY